METATATTALVTVTVNNAPAAKMYVTINYQLADGTFVNSNVVTVTDDGTEVRTVSVPELTGYTLRNSTVPVPFVANSTPTKPVVVDPIVKYAVTAKTDHASFSVASQDVTQLTATGGDVVVTFTGGDWSDGSKVSISAKTNCDAVIKSVGAADSHQVTVSVSNVTGACDFTITYTP